MTQLHKPWQMGGKRPIQNASLRKPLLNWEIVAMLEFLGEPYEQPFGLAEALRAAQGIQAWRYQADRWLSGALAEFHGVHASEIFAYWQCPSELWSSRLNSLEIGQEAVWSRANERDASAYLLRPMEPLQFRLMLGGSARYWLDANRIIHEWRSDGVVRDRAYQHVQRPGAKLQFSLERASELTAEWLENCFEQINQRLQALIEHEWQQRRFKHMGGSK